MDTTTPVPVVFANVLMSVVVQMSRAEFATDVIRTAYISGVSSVLSVDETAVSIVSVVENVAGRRRKLLATSVVVETNVVVPDDQVGAVTSRIDVNTLRTALLSNGILVTSVTAGSNGAGETPTRTSEDDSIPSTPLARLLCCDWVVLVISGTVGIGAVVVGVFCVGTCVHFRSVRKSNKIADADAPILPTTPTSTRRLSEAGCLSRPNSRLYASGGALEGLPDPYASRAENFGSTRRLSEAGSLPRPNSRLYARGGVLEGLADPYASVVKNAGDSTPKPVGAVGEVRTRGIGEPAGAAWGGRLGCAEECCAATTAFCRRVLCMRPAWALSYVRAPVTHDLSTIDMGP